MCTCGVWDCGYYSHLRDECPSDAGTQYRERIERRKRRNAMSSQLSIGIKPLADKVIILPDQQAETTEGGIIIPSVATDAPTTGTVVAVGPGKTNDKGQVIPMEVQYGDRVLFRARAGSELTHGGKKYRLVSEVSIDAVLED